MGGNPAQRPPQRFRIDGRQHFARLPVKPPGRSIPQQGETRLQRILFEKRPARHRALVGAFHSRRLSHTLTAARFARNYALVSSPRGDAMARTADLPAPDLRQGMLETYAVNDHINQLILEHLDPRAWHAKPPGRSARTIAAIFAHMHNIRRKWLRLSAPHLKLPAQLDRTRCTQREARTAFAQSAACCSELLAEVLSGPRRRV